MGTRPSSAMLWSFSAWRNIRFVLVFLVANNMKVFLTINKTEKQKPNDFWEYVHFIEREK